MKDTQTMTFRELNTQADIDRHIRHRLKTAVSPSDIRDITDEMANAAYKEEAEQALRQFTYDRINAFNNILSIAMLFIDMVSLIYALIRRISDGSPLPLDIQLSIHAFRLLIALVLFRYVTCQYREPADLQNPSNTIKAVLRCSAVLPSLYVSMPLVSFMLSVSEYPVPFITLPLTIALPIYFSAVFLKELHHEGKINATSVEKNNSED